MIQTLSENYLDRMYPTELEIKDTTESNTFASYLNLLLSIGREGQLRTSIYHKHDDFIFHITYFPFLSGNIPSSPANGVFIPLLVKPGVGGRGFRFPRRLSLCLCVRRPSVCQSTRCPSTRFSELFSVVL